MSRCGAILSRRTICFPRVSGDEPLKALGMQGEQMFSPRERG